MMTQSAVRPLEKKTTASACTSSAMGMITKLASRFAARTLVVWLEITTAALTITSVSTAVSSQTCASSTASGR